MSEAQTLLAGTRVGDYLIEGVLGEGGMGAVYAGIHPRIGKEVAIKVLYADCASDLQLSRRFEREAQTLNKIHHPGVVDVFGFGVLPDGRPYLVMERLKGKSLEE